MTNCIIELMDICLTVSLLLQKHTGVVFMPQTLHLRCEIPSQLWAWRVGHLRIRSRPIYRSRELACHQAEHQVTRLQATPQSLFLRRRLTRLSAQLTPQQPD